MADDVSLKFGIKGDLELKQSLSDITAGLKVNKSEMELVTAEYGKNAQSSQALAAKGAVLEKIIASQTEKVKELADGLAKESSLAEYLSILSENRPLLFSCIIIFILF